MATRITKCDECESDDITTMNPELKDTAKSPTVKLKAKCNKCGHEFQYHSGTAHGKRMGIRY